jgi:flagellar FliL protein
MSQAAESKDPPKKSKKGLLIGLAAVLLLGAGGGGAWFYMNRGEPDPEAAAAAAMAKAKAARVFVTLEPFVVNLANRDSERYAQVGVVLEVTGKAVETKVSAAMPAVRNEILLLISSKVADQLLDREGKEKLASEIALAAARPLGWEPPEDDGDDEPPPRKGKDGKEAKDGKDSKAAKAKPKKAPAPNPVAQVHFASFIVQ